MAFTKALITLLFASFVFVSPAISGYSPTTIKAWCSQTPHPQPCEYFLSHNPKYKIPIKGKSDLFKLSSELALDRCMHAHNNLYSLSPKCRNKHEKAAWADCIELYGHTIHRINRTVDPHTKCTNADAQTWLSTALTNLETCKSGFIDLNITDYVFPLMSNNVSMLLSNTLVLNKDIGANSTNKPTSYKNGVYPGDRKLLQASTPRANVVVAQDGSGNYRTLSDAIAAVGKRSGSGSYVIHVKQGTYRENVNIGTSLKNIMLLGDGIGKTIITGSRSVGGGTTTFKSATVAVVGDGFIARGITFRNTAGAQNHQAVPFDPGQIYPFSTSAASRATKTLYMSNPRGNFTASVTFYGTVDFIFGNAAVVLQNCNIYPRNMPTKTNTITAQGRTDPNQNTGISIHNCRVTAAPDLRPVQGSIRTYLGRPWQKYSRTVFMKTDLDSLIDPAGWMPWSGNFALDTLYYGEYVNTGAGSGTSRRVKWKGYRVITSASEASRFAPGNFIAANSWIPATNVPFTSGM